MGNDTYGRMRDWEWNASRLGLVVRDGFDGHEPTQIVLSDLGYGRQNS
jgi:hypothetical protein